MRVELNPLRVPIGGSEPSLDRQLLRTRSSQGAFDAAIYGLGVLIDLRLEAGVARYSSEVELIVKALSSPSSPSSTRARHACPRGHD